MFFGPNPSQELLDRRPGDLSLQSAFYAWHVGFKDGAESATHAVFAGESAEGIQMLYDDGYERGERERSVVDRMESRHGECASVAEQMVPAAPTAQAEGRAESREPEEATMEITVDASSRDVYAKARDAAITLSACVLAALFVWRGLRGSP